MAQSSRDNIRQSGSSRECGGPARSSSADLDHGTRLCLHMSWRTDDAVSTACWVKTMETLWAHLTIRQRLQINRGTNAFGQEAILARHERGRAGWRSCARPNRSMTDRKTRSG